MCFPSMFKHSSAHNTEEVRFDSDCYTKTHYVKGKFKAASLDKLCRKIKSISLKRLGSYIAL